MIVSLHQRDLGIAVVNNAKCEMEVSSFTGIHNNGLSVWAHHAEGRVSASVSSFIPAQKVIHQQEKFQRHLSSV